MARRGSQKNIYATNCILGNASLPAASHQMPQRPSQFPGNQTEEQGTGEEEEAKRETEWKRQGQRLGNDKCFPLSAKHNQKCCHTPACLPACYCCSLHLTFSATNKAPISDRVIVDSTRGLSASKFCGCVVAKMLISVLRVPCGKWQLVSTGWEKALLLISRPIGTTFGV